MSARSGQWDLLHHHRDPVPGDELVVQRLARVHTATADAIEDCADKLRRLSRLEGWTGEAAERFAEGAEDVAGDLAKAERRYREAGAALQEFVAPLREARDESWGALREAVAADEARRAHSGDLLTGVAEPTPEQVSAQQRRAALRREAEIALGRAATRLSAALSTFGRAADRCADALDDASETYKDSRWDNVKGKARDLAKAIHLDRIVDVLGKIAIALAVVGIALAVLAALVVSAPAWLPVLIGGVAVAGVVVGALSLAGNSWLLASDHEEGSWTAVGIDIAGLATLGIGRLLTRAAGRSAAVSRANIAATTRTTASADEARRLAATARGRAALNGQSIRNPQNPLRRWADEEAARMAGRAGQAGDRAATAVEAARQSELAAEIARLRALPGAATDPAVQQQLAHAQRLATGGRVLDGVSTYGGDLGANTADVALEAHTGRGLGESFDDYVARVEWRLTR